MSGLSGAAASGPWETIEKIEAATDATIEMVTGITADYHAFRATLTGVVGSINTAKLELTLSDDAGATWKAGSGYSSIGNGQIVGAALTTTANNSGKIVCNADITNGTLSSGTGEAFNGVFDFNDLADAGTYPMVGINGFYQVTSGASCLVSSSSRLGSLIAINGLRWKMNTGNIVIGHFHLEGLKH